MALAKNKHGYDVVVDLGTGSRTVRDGELVEVPDEYLRYHVLPESVWEVRGKPEFAALSIEEERAQAEAEAVDEPVEDLGIAEREAADKAAADALAAAWDDAGPKTKTAEPVGEPVIIDGEPV